MNRRRTRSRAARRTALLAESLESRHLLAAGPLLHTHNVDELAIVNVSTGEIETLTSMDGFVDENERMSDIAFGPEGQLYGITSDQLYEIHPVNGDLTPLGQHGITNANALIYDSTGRLLAMGRNSSEVFRLNLSGDTLSSTTRFATLSGLGDGGGSAGDITFMNGELVVATNDSRLLWFRFDVNPDRPRLVREIDLADMGLDELFGLSVYGDTLYATGESLNDNDDVVVRFDLSNPNFPSANIVAVDETFGDLRGAAHYTESGGPVPIGTASGIKWEDLNGDGIQQPNEPELHDWPVYIDENLNGVYDPEEGEPLDRTDALGRYHFYGLEPGLYTIDEIIEDTAQAWRQTTPQVEHRHLVADYDFDNPNANNHLVHDGGLPDMTASFISFSGGNARFNNATSFLELPVPLGEDPFTIAIDASYSTNIGSELFLVSQRSAEETTTHDFQLSAAATTRDLSASFCNAGGDCTDASFGSVESQRHQYALTWDGRNVGVFVDDVLITRTVAGVIPDIDGDVVRFGDPFDATTRAALQGDVHGIRIYNTALSESDLIDAFQEVRRPTAYSIYVDDLAGLETLDFGNRIQEAPDGPEIEVRRDANNGTEIVTGATIDLGTAATVEAALSIELFINNLGDEELSLDVVDVTNGFEITGGLASRVQPGGSTSFVVTLTDNTVGDKTGQITITNNDADENPFVINLTGKIVQIDDRPRDLLINTAAGNLLRVNKVTGTTETLMTGLVDIRDIAHHPTENLLIGIGRSSIYELDIDTNTATPLFAHQLTNQTALAFSPFGELFSAGMNVHKIDLQSETTSVFATGGVGQAGDLAFEGTTMLLSTANDRLYRVANGSSTLIGESAATLTGLASVDADTVYGFSSNQAFTVNTENATLGPQFSFFLLDIRGATYQPPIEDTERDPLDVNDDGIITPFDAILVINELNEPQFTDPNTGRLIHPTVAPTLYPDVNGDNFVQPLDVILIINRLNGG